jgi:hypothetical protein
MKKRSQAMIDAQKRYYERNKERIIARQSRWNKENVELHNEASRRWMSANRPPISVVRAMVEKIASLEEKVKTLEEKYPEGENSRSEGVVEIEFIED